MLSHTCAHSHNTLGIMYLFLPCRQPKFKHTHPGCNFCICADTRSILMPQCARSKVTCKQRNQPPARSWRALTRRARQSPTLYTLQQKQRQGSRRWSSRGVQQQHQEDRREGPTAFNRRAIILLCQIIVNMNAGKTLVQHTTQ